MEQNLNTTTGGGTQTSTQDPQSATSESGLSSSDTNTVQTGTVNPFSSPQSGTISLTPTAVSTVSLKSTGTTTTKNVAPVVKTHHANGVLIGIIVAVFIVAVITFWRSTMPEKTTTE